MDVGSHCFTAFHDPSTVKLISIICNLNWVKLDLYLLMVVGSHCFCEVKSFLWDCDSLIAL